MRLKFEANFSHKIDSLQERKFQRRRDFAINDETGEF